MKYNLSMLFFMIFLASCSKNIDKKALIEVENITYDFGNILVGDTVTATFTIRNKGNDDLKIKNVIGSCGCTIVNLSDSLLSKNELALISAKYISQDDDIGFVKKSVIVETNIDSSFVVFYITGKVNK